MHMNMYPLTFGRNRNPAPDSNFSHNLRMGPLTVQVRLGLGFSADLPGKIGTPFPRRGSRAEREVMDLRFIVHILHGKIHISYFMDLRGWGD